MVLSYLSNNPLEEPVKRLLARTLVVATVMAAVSACQPPTPATAPPDYAATLGPVTDQFITVWNTKNYRPTRVPAARPR